MAPTQLQKSEGQFFAHMTWVFICLVVFLELSEHDCTHFLSEDHISVFLFMHVPEAISLLLKHMQLILSPLLIRNEYQSSSKELWQSI